VQTQLFEPFFVLRSSSPRASEVHLVGTIRGAGHDDVVMIELAAFVRSCLEVLGEGGVEVMQLSEDDRCRGFRVVVDDTKLAVIRRQTIPRVHDLVADWIQCRYPNKDVIC